ncbi:GNAT family N-acetyltransferase [Patulibacter minatonensis]|uniref:GNAT family N-acetyltransferase n=1 Tax=Patulibacter minatonensis TaxID=298163 RepID=UPI0004B96DB8|nr:GNAT family protein [Patulibacter minatonensis]
MAPELGPPVDFAGARAPGRETLTGTHVRLEPLDPADHAAALWDAAASGDPHLWDYLPYGPFDDRAAFDAWLVALHAGMPADQRFFAIVRVADDVPAGMLAYARIAPELGRIEIAHVWFGAALQRTPDATEAVFLLAAHAFEALGNRRLEWKCNALNARSRRAAERFGFAYEGTFRQDMVVKGRNRDTAWFSLLDREWPRAGAAFRDWLAADNFAEDGTQRRTLEDLRGGAAGG